GQASRCGAGGEAEEFEGVEGADDPTVEGEDGDEADVLEVDLGVAQTLGDLGDGVVRPRDHGRRRHPAGDRIPAVAGDGHHAAEVGGGDGAEQLRGDIGGQLIDEA